MIPDGDAAERSSRRIFWWVVGVVVTIIAGVLLLPELERELAPKPLRAWAAVEAEGSGVAVVGTVEMAAGTPFHLHAVIEAEGRGGARVFYTEAPALILDGRPVPAEALRRWDRAATVKVLWFTVEGVVPYLELAPGEGLERFRFEAFFHPEWGLGWSVPGRLEPANDIRLTREDRQGRLPFGTQRFQARVEIYDREAEGFPGQRLLSPGPQALPADAGAVATALVTLPGAAAPASAVFGLTGIGTPPDADRELLTELARLTREHLAFHRLALLAEILQTAGVSAAEDLDWQRIDLAAARPWGDGGVAAGDLLRVGNRFVVLYRDQGAPGVLDREDLCFDYARGSVVRRLDEVFAAEGGDVEWVHLAAAAAAGA